MLYAKDKKTSRSVAQAFLIDPKDPEKVEAFSCRSKLTAGLQHPNIIPLYDAGYDIYDRPFFTMKPVEGITLDGTIKDLKKQDKVDYQELSTIFLKICDAISYAHSEMLFTWI